MAQISVPKAAAMSGAGKASGKALRIRLPAPHPGQQLVRTQARRFNWLCCGRRWRKTTLAMAVNVEGALAGQKRIWGAPTFKQVRVCWDEMRKACDGVVTFNESRMEASFPGGGAVYFMSLDDPQNARGYTADGVTMDETPHCSERAWREVLRPMLLDTGGDAWFTFTPLGQEWVYDEFELAKERDDSLAVQAPTLGAQVVDGQLVRVPHPLENPDISFAELLQIWRTTPEQTFRQEILAEFLPDGGAAFRNIQACVGGELLSRPPGGQGAYHYVIGVDLAKYNDYTVVVVADALSRQVVHFDRWNMCDWSVTKARIAGLAEKWNHAAVWMDATGVGDPVYDDLFRAGVRVQPYVFTEASREQLLENAILMVEQQSVRFPRIDVLISELKSMGYKRTPSGRLKMMAPESRHDDCIMAFALCLWPLAHAGGGLSELMQGLLGQTTYAGRQHSTTATEMSGGYGGARLLRKDF